jgi:hypothetical protein
MGKSRVTRRIRDRSWEAEGIDEHTCWAPTPEAVSHEAKQSNSRHTTAPSPVYDSIGDLNSTVQAVESVVDDLALRLGTVLCDVPECGGECCEKAPPAPCDLCDTINSTNRRLQGVLGKLAALERRLQL